MSKLAIDTFDVRGFRALRDIRLEGLQRANLIVGRNNVGKTFLLEAIRLYIHRGAPWLLRNLVVDRHEAPGSTRGTSTPEAMNAWLEAFENLFYGRPQFGVDTIEPIRIESVAR